MEMNVPIYYFHSQSKSFFPITPFHPHLPDTGTHNVPSVIHKLAMKLVEVFRVVCDACLCNKRQIELVSIGCHAVDSLACLPASRELPHESVFPNSGACGQTKPHTQPSFLSSALARSSYQHQRPGKQLGYFRKN